MSGATAAAALRNREKMKPETTEEEDGAHLATQFLLQQPSAKQISVKGELANLDESLSEEKNQDAESPEDLLQDEEEAGRAPRNGQNDALASGSVIRDGDQGQTYQRIKTEAAASAKNVAAEPFIEADFVALDDPVTAEEKRRAASAAAAEDFHHSAHRVMAATRIARMWLNRRYNKYMDRDILADRLDLEDKLGRGCLKITINVTMFILIISCLSLGIPASEKLATKHLITNALDLDTFLEIQTIDGLRDFLPELSANIKVFSAASVTVAGTEILSQRAEFTDPVTINEFAPTISQPAWTLSAWVERIAEGVSGSSQQEFLSILRQPMATNRSLSCWGWFHPRQLRFGAHDFFQFEEVSTQLEEEVSIAVREGEDVTSLAMETLTVSDGVATFFHNDVKLGSMELPRAMTDCINPDPVELGQVDLALSGVKFYSRALSENEVEEMYRGGQPLFELASGSGLPRLEQEELLQLAVKLEKQGVALTENLQEKEERDVVGALLGEPLQPDDPLLQADDPTFPTDASPPAVLPGGDRTAGLLPQKEREAWEAGGKRTAGFLTGRWESDASLGGRLFWSVFDDPIYADGSPLAEGLPRFEESTEAVSISFWFKTTTFVRAYGPHVRLLHGPELGGGSCTVGSEESADFNMQTELDWVLMQLRVGTSCVRDWRYLTYFDKESGRIRETYLLSAFAQEVLPVTWRHLMYQYDGRTGVLKFFLDGRLAVETSEAAPTYSASYHRDLPLPLRKVSDIFSNMTVVPHSWSQGGEWESIPGKMAQFRVFPWALSPSEVLAVQEGARWPSGAAVKQCADPETDENYFDSTNLDARRQSCEWYYRMQLRYPYICRLKWVKSMCPVVCSGKRLCHDGRLKIGFNQTEKPKTYWLFDRIQYLKPKQDGESVLCRSHDLDTAKVLDECERIAREEAKGEASTLSADEAGYLREFRRFLTSSFTGTVRFDVTNCSQLRVMLEDPLPCTFNASWLKEFEGDFNRTSTWSLTFWLRPKAGSFGMPTNFWFAAKFFSSLAPPTILKHWTEFSPDLEPWMDAYTLTRNADGTIRRRRAAIWPTTNIDYVNEWTMYHFQFQDLKDGRYRICGSINAIPMDCSVGAGEMLINPRHLIQAMEFTSEMLVSPISVTSAWFSKAEIQMRFYRKVAGMGRVLGPLRATHDPKAVASAEDEQQGAEGFNQRVALLAPPLMYQTRAKQKVCDRTVTSTFLEGQMELKRAALCKEGDKCAWVTTDTIATCFDRGQLEDREFWGNPARSHGFSEFLYISDSPNIVRPNQNNEKTVVQTREFVNGLTMTASVLAMFHSPVTGLTTAVELSADVATAAVQTRVEFLHLGFVDESKMVEQVVSYTCLILLIVALILNALHMLWRYRRYRASHGQGYKVEILDYTTDLVQGAIILALSIFSLLQAVHSVSTIEEIVGDIRKVSWIDRDVPFAETVDQFFRGVDRFRSQLDYEYAVNTIAVAILFGLLVRIFAGTSLHPHTGVLVGTVKTTILDLHHFFLLFMLINCLFAFAATWVFGHERDEFQDMKSALDNQFMLLLDPNLPENYDEDPLLVAYVVSSTVVIFFFMLNFLLAVVVDGYMKVREQIQLNEAEFEFITDLVFTIYAKLKGFIQQWPRKKDVALKLRELHVKRVCATHLRNQGLPIQGTMAMFKHYAEYKALQCAPPEWKGVFYNYDRADHLSVQSFQRMMNSVELLRVGMAAMQERLGMETVTPSAASQLASIPISAKAKRRNSLLGNSSNPTEARRISIKAPPPATTVAGNAPSSPKRDGPPLSPRKTAHTSIIGRRTSVDRSAHGPGSIPNGASQTGIAGIPSDIQRLLPGAEAVFRTPRTSADSLVGTC